MSKNSLIKKNEEIISVAADNNVNVDVYVESLYNIKRQNLESKVLVKYLNIEFEVLETDSVESLRNKLFYNLYDSLDKVNRNHPHLLNENNEKGTKAKIKNSVHKNQKTNNPNKIAFSEVNGDFNNLMRYIKETFKQLIGK